MWPDATDKEDREWGAPIDSTVRAALDRVLRERPGIGSAYLFPSPADQTRPIDYGLASDWLLEAERLAELPKLERGVWHPYRRKWATVRKHLPLSDVAAAGGWKSTQTLLKCYQQPDEATMLQVVLGGLELRERKGVKMRVLAQEVGALSILATCVEVSKVVVLRLLGPVAQVVRAHA